MVPVTQHECRLINDVLHAHFPLVQGWLRDELISAGHHGLAQAAHRYNPQEHTTRFDTYAWWRIRGAMRDTLRAHDHLTRPHRQAVTNGQAHDPGPPVPLNNAHLATIPDPHDHYATIDAEQAVHHALDQIPEREALVVRCLDLHDWTTRDVADLLGVTTSRITQLRRRAHQHMRPHLEHAA